MLQKINKQSEHATDNTILSSDSYGFLPPFAFPRQKMSAIIKESQNITISVYNDAGTQPSRVRTHEQTLKALLEELMPIDYREKAGLADGEPLTMKHNIVITIEQILETAKKNHWSLCYAEGNMFVYNGQFWKQIQKDEILTFLGQAAEKLGVEKFSARYHQFRNELLKQFFSSALLPRHERSGVEVLINLKNGTYVFTTEKQFLRHFDRDDFLRYQLPFSYDKQAQAPLFMKYINRVLPDQEKQKILAEFIGYVFIRQEALKLEKALILYGEGANGKSVFFEIMKALLGNGNVSHYSLQSLTNESGYQRAKLSGKLLNYASEISVHMDTAIFKQLVSGEPVEARLPYGSPFILNDYAKLVFNTNTLPKDVEQTRAFFRRFLIINFDVTIPEAERDPQLASKIIQTELAGVFNWVLEGLHRLLEQRNFTHSAAVEETLEQYQKKSDSVHLFIDEMAYEPSVKQDMPLKVLYTEYTQYCLDSDCRPASVRLFCDRLDKLGFKKQRKNTGNVVGVQKKNCFEHATRPTLPAQSPLNIVPQCVASEEGEVFRNL